MASIEERLYTDGERFRAARPVSDVAWQPPREPRHNWWVPAAAAVAVMAVIAVSVAVTRHVPHRAPATPTTWASQPLAAGYVRHVFGPHVQYPSGNCDTTVTGVAAASDGTVYVSEATCMLQAGYGEPGRTHATSSRPPHVLDVLHPDGHVTAVGFPRGTGTGRVLTVAPDGTVYGYGGDGQLLSWRAGAGWRALSAAQKAAPVHTGDRGPVRDAKVITPVGAAVGRDGSLYVAEPYAVRRIDRAGVITTIAGAYAEETGHRFEPAKPATQVPAGPVKATTTVLPLLRGMVVTDDGTVWLAATDAVYTVSHGTLRRVLGPHEGLTLGLEPRVGDTGGSWLVGMATSPGSGTIYLYDGGLARVLALDTRTLRLTLVLPAPGGRRLPFATQFGADATATIPASSFNLPVRRDQAAASRLALTARGDLLLGLDYFGVVAVGHPATLTAADSPTPSSTCTLQQFSLAADAPGRPTPRDAVDAFLASSPAGSYPDAGWSSTPDGTTWTNGNDQLHVARVSSGWVVASARRCS